jgi:hypothetical protein
VAKHDPPLDDDELPAAVADAHLYLAGACPRRRVQCNPCDRPSLPQPNEALAEETLAS